MKHRANPWSPALVAIVLTFNSSIGWSNAFRCGNVATDPESSIDDVIRACDAPILSYRGCTINIEKACINGFEVDFLRNIAGTLEGGTGFKRNSSDRVHGVTSSDFKDPKDLYKMVKIGNRDQKLCLEAKGVEVSYINANLPFGTDQLDSMDKKFVLESVPSFIKPDVFSSDTSLHWKVTKQQNDKEQDEFTVELEIRSLEEVDKSAKSYKKSDRTSTKATGRGATLDQAVENAGYAFNTESKVVRCLQKQNFFSLKQYKPEVKGIYIEYHKRLMNQLSNTLRDTDQLTRNFQNNLGYSQMAAEPAPPAQDKRHVKHDSQRKH